MSTTRLLAALRRRAGLETRSELIARLGRAFGIERPKAPDAWTDERIRDLAEGAEMLGHADCYGRACECFWCRTWRLLSDVPEPGEVAALDTIERLLGREAREALDAATPEELVQLVTMAKHEVGKEGA